MLHLTNSTSKCFILPLTNSTSKCCILHLAISTSKMFHTPPYKFNLKMIYTPLCKRLVWHYSKHILILLNEPLNYLTVDKVFLILMSINRLLFSKKRLRISVNENAIPSLEQLQRCSLYELTN